METERKPKIKLHSGVCAVMKNYRGIGMSTPFATINKCSILLDETYIHHRVAIVVIDAIRCSTTLLASLGAGVEAVTVMVKGGEKGTPSSVAQLVAKQLDLQMVTAGELNGMPMPGGVIGNCPSEAAACAELSGKLLHFQSTNFGSAFSEVALTVNEFRRIGGTAEIYIASFVNAAMVAKEISTLGYDRVLISCGGFYDNLSLEDDLVGGQIFSLLNLSMDELDDEGRVMLTSFRNFSTPIKQFEVLKSNWISSSLIAFNKEDDVKTVLWGEGIIPSTYKRMQQLVPKVSWFGTIPVIKSNLSRLKVNQPDHLMVLATDISWKDAPRGMPSGSKAMIIQGNPKHSGLFAMRHKIPANWKVMPHTHTADEHITVLSGSCYLGIGKAYDEDAATKLLTGSFTVMKAGTAHFFFTREDCVIQIHGMGPQNIAYINFIDDPRNSIIKLDGTIDNNLITLKK
jgi:phosphosulfolactate phosphohydrolase-like enzyme/quercetin dioxygenase-like cupin family protein